MNLKKIGKVFTSKFVGTGPSSYKKRIYRVAVSQTLRNTALEDTPALHIFIRFRRVWERCRTQLRHICLTQQGENGYILLIKIKVPC